MCYNERMSYEEIRKTFSRLSGWYYANKTHIDTGHEGEFVLLYRTDVVGYFGTWDKAELYALKNKFTEGLFLIHKCDLDEKPVCLPYEVPA